MLVDAITEREVRRALRSIRYARALDDSPLLDLASVTARLRADGLLDSQAARATALVQLLAEVIDSRLGEMRRQDGVAKSADTSPSSELAWLLQDFGGRSLGRQAWALLHYRYFAADPYPVRELVDHIGISEKTYERRLDRGYKLLASELRAMETQTIEDVARPHNLPNIPTSFIGRERTIAATRDALAENRLVTLTGPGGIGKSRVAIQLATDLAPDYRDGAWFVELADIDDGRLVPSWILTALGVGEKQGCSSQDSLISHLAGKHLLLLVDNCEHVVVHVRDAVRELLRQTSQLQILATSREELRAPGEAVITVPPMPIQSDWERASAAGLAHQDAARLLGRRAAAAVPGFVLDDSNIAHVVKLCSELDGIPLAIELAAARLRHMSLIQLEERLTDRFLLLRGPSGSGMRPGHETMRAVLDLSHSLLDAHEQRLLRRLSVFRGGWSLAAAEATCAGNGIESRHVLELLDQLVVKSLITVVRTHDTVRYSVLETVRSYSDQILRRSHEASQTRDKHLGYYLALAQDCDSAYREGRVSSSLAALDHEIANCWAALEWALEAGDTDAAMLLCGALTSYWSIRGQWEEGLAAIHGSLESYGHEPSPASRATALVSAALLLMRKGEFADAASHAERGLSAAKKAEDGGGSYKALFTLGRIAIDQGEAQAANEYLSESLSFTDSAGVSEVDVARTLAGLGEAARLSGDLAEAQSMFEQALDIRRHRGDDLGIASGLLNLGNIAHRQGRYEDALGHHRESLSTHRRLGDPNGEARCLVNMAACVSRLGDSAEAVKLYGEALNVFRSLGAKKGMAIAQHNIAIELADQGHAEQARELHRQSLDLRCEIGDAWGQAYSLAELGALAIAQGDHAEARRRLRESLEIRHGLGLRPGVAMVLAYHTMLSSDMANHRRAARLAGFTDCLFDDLDMHCPLPEYADASETARARLGGSEFDISYRLGRALTLDEAVAYALGEVTWDELEPVVAERLAAGDDGAASDLEDAAGEADHVAVEDDDTAAEADDADYADLVGGGK